MVRFNSTEFESPVMHPMSGPLDHQPVLHSKLVLLDLSYATIPPADLYDLLSTCNLLKKLSLESLALSDDVCSVVAANKKLTTLNLSMATGLTPRGMETIFAGCPLLDELNLGWTSLKKDIGAVCAVLPASLVKLCICGYRNDLQNRQVELRKHGLFSPPQPLFVFS